MEFIRPDINLDIIGKRKIAFTLSLLLIAASLASLIVNGGPKYGIDFAGGTAILIKFQEPTDTESVRQALAPLGLAKSTVQQYGAPGNNEYRIRTDLSQMKAVTGKEAGKSAVDEEDSLSVTIGNLLKQSTGKALVVRSVEMVGPQVGKDLREKALSAMFYALLFITIYISGRFELKWVPSLITAGILSVIVWFFSNFISSLPVLMLIALVCALISFYLLKLQYAMGAIVALLHDVLITVGIFSLFGLEFTLPIIAALLTIIGYSLNDTIIVYDRIRENSKKLNRQPLDFVINRSINETLSRTILTSLTTMVVVICLYVLGGEIIHDFAFALMIGVVVGTYSSIYVASPILLVWQSRSLSKQAMATKKKA